MSAHSPVAVQGADLVCPEAGAAPGLGRAGDRLTVLLIEDSLVDAALVEQMLAAIPAVTIDLRVERTLEAGISRLAAAGPDLVLLDLSLPDSRGLRTFQRVAEAATTAPVVVISSHDDEAMGVEAVRLGAQDYLTKGDVTSASLARALRYAVARHRQVTSLRDLSLVDDLTGLYNRRGFMTLAGSQLQLALRAGRRLLIVYADLDGLKRINDSLGHSQGDAALSRTGAVLRATFRQSDILARLGGDEFAVVAVEAANDSEGMLLARLEAHVQDFNRNSTLPFDLSLSAGVVAFDPAGPASLEDMLVEADKAAYSRKRAKKAERSRIHH